MCKTLVELRTALQLFHCSVLKIFTLLPWSVRVGSMENCCLFAEIFNILYQQRCWTTETMTNFRAINGPKLNSLLPFLEIASTSLRSEYVTYVSASVGRNRTRQSYLRSLFSSWCFWYCNFLWYLPVSTICSYLREVISALSCSNDKVVVVVVVVVICFAFQSGAWPIKGCKS